MADLPRFDELFNTFVREAVYRGSANGVTEDTYRTPGSDGNAIAAAAATVGEEVLRQVALGLKDSMLGTAEDDALDRYIQDHYIDPATNEPLKRHDATTSLVTLTFSRAAGPMLAGTIAIGTRVGTDAGIEVATIEPLALALSQASGTVLARAVVAGPDGNVGAGTLRRIRSTVFDTNLTVTNAARAAGGNPRESDEDYAGRARKSYQALRRGTLEAIEFGALQVSGVSMARASTVDLLSDTGAVLARWVRLAVADGSGRSNAALTAAVSAAMPEWQGAGTYVEVVGGAAVDVQVRIAFSVRAGANTMEVVARVRAAVASLINGLRVGETLKLNAIYEVVRKDRDVVQGSVQVLEPLVDVVPSSSQVLRTTADAVQVTA